VGFLGALAQDIYYVHTKDAGVVEIPGEPIDSVKVEGDAIQFYAGNNLLYTNTLANVDSIRFIEPPVTQTAYPYGIPHLPGIVEAENFDKGGEGVAYHDNTENNTQEGAYRLSPEDQGVDIQAGGGYSNGFIVADIEAGEWLSYTINAPTAGKYGFAFWVMNDTDVTFEVLIDGNSIGQATVPNTSWELKQISGPAAVLSAGIHIVTFNFTGGFGFDKFSFKTNEAYPDGIPHAPGVVEGEDFDKGGEGIGYHDSDAWNADNGTDYRTDPEDGGVDIQKGGGYSNGYALVGIAPDEWTNYTINAPEAGIYAFSFWTLNDQPVTFDLVIDGEQVGQVAVPNSGWGVVKVTGPDVQLSAGNHTVTLQFNAGFGLDKFEFVDKGLIGYKYPKTEWFVEANSYFAEAAAFPSNIIDNDFTTIWHSALTTNPPHCLVIDMMETKPVYCVDIIQQSPFLYGNQVQLYLSNTPVTPGAYDASWGSPAVEGIFGGEVNLVLKFPDGKSGRWLIIYYLDSLTFPYMNCAEVNVYGEAPTE
jgi:hypothetical protein